MHWYLVHTKPRQERIALEQLERQGYPCYLPLLRQEKTRAGNVSVVDEPLFPRYLFVELGETLQDRSWAPIRSTRGVSRLVTFGSQPARVPEALVAALQTQEAARQGQVVRLFEVGDRVCIAEGPFAGVEGIYQLEDGDRRVMVLIELMSRPVAVPVGKGGVRRVG
jgi:transcriptional antiterminator RfaH